MRGVNGSWAELVIAHPDFGRMEGAACQHWCAALLLAHPALYSYLRLCKIGQYVRPFRKSSLAYPRTSEPNGRNSSNWTGH